MIIINIIKFRLVSGIILIPATADGKGGYFAFDTGASRTAINKEYFPEFKGEEVEVVKFSEDVKKAGAIKGVLPLIKFSNVEIENKEVLIMDLMYVENALKQLVPNLVFLGSIGMDIIGNYNILLDYKNEEINLNPKIDFENKKVVSLEMDTLPIINLEILNKEYRFVLDTGANTCLLDESFKDNKDIVPKSEESSLLLIPCVNVSGLEFKEVSAVISDISSIKKKVNIDGVIGYQILSQNKTVLDFKNKCLIFEIE